MSGELPPPSCTRCGRAIFSDASRQSGVCGSCTRELHPQHVAAGMKARVRL